MKSTFIGASMIDVSKYKPIDTNFLGSLMILVDAVYFQRLDPSHNEVIHRLSLLFYHKRKSLNKNGSYWDIWSRILYMSTPSKCAEYTQIKHTEFSKFFLALTGQEITGKFEDDTLRQMGLDLVDEIKNNNYVFNMTWLKRNNFFYIQRIKKSNYVIERPAIIEWPKKILEAYPEIEDARPVVED